MPDRMWWAIARERTIDHDILYVSPKNDFERCWLFEGGATAKPRLA